MKSHEELSETGVACSVKGCKEAIDIHTSAIMSSEVMKQFKFLNRCSVSNYLSSVFCITQRFHGMNLRSFHCRLVSP
jgi:hypothetical protein